MTKDMNEKINVKPIGIINTPYKKPEGMPIQGKFEKNVIGTARIFSQYKKGLKGVEGFSHLILIYHFNHSKEEWLTGKPFLEDVERGIFAIRAPNRPNHIGFSIVKLKSVKGNTIIFTEVDILDKTPLLDIKPYVKHFDSRDKVKNGWIEKHFRKRQIPKRVKII
ncbi:MAG: tRNA (N6-threonylcarbamoyladenosine(37)-N6)-methyltransferase TrmO [Candidatus Omnitrophica bacterium]|nr:tRNA (N6-threonylcarbamoyladenosine(37)-N6)-methyltransferase TrmO [Candidatus Omnitrophota bacterium]